MSLRIVISMERTSALVGFSSKHSLISQARAQDAHGQGGIRAASRVSEKRSSRLRNPNLTVTQPAEYLSFLYFLFSFSLAKWTKATPRPAAKVSRSSGRRPDNHHRCAQPTSQTCRPTHVQIDRQWLSLTETSPLAEGTPHTGDQNKDRSTGIIPESSSASKKS